jgi:MerR HTH family regulatory protein/GAF domain
MLHLKADLLQRSEAIAIGRVDDGVLIDASDAFLSLTGCQRGEVVGRPALGLLIPIHPGGHALITGALREQRSIGGVPVGIRGSRNRPRVGGLSVLITEVERQRYGLFVFGESREPSWEERCLAAQLELGQLASGVAGPRNAVTVLRILAGWLDWELGVLWEPDDRRGGVRCAATWRSPSSGLVEFERATRRMVLAAGLGLLGRGWAKGAPAWVRDVARERDFPRRGESGAQPHGWLAFPVLAGNRPIAFVELLRSEPGDPDPVVLGALDDLGRQVGQVLRTPARANGGELPAQRPSHQGSLGGGAVSHQAQLHELLGDLQRLNQRVDELLQSNGHPAGPPGPPAPEAARQDEPQLELPAGLTLRAVSDRTGISTATIRNWERRYNVIRPQRAAGGYRLYDQQDVERILRVKRLLEQGIRVREAAAAVVSAVGSRQRLRAEASAGPEAGPG